MLVPTKKQGYGLNRPYKSWAIYIIITRINHLMSI